MGRAFAMALGIAVLALSACGDPAAPPPSERLTEPALIGGITAVENAYAAYEAVLSNPQRQFGDLATSKGFARDLRAALDDFDTTLREQDFGTAVQEQVNATLAASGALSAALDAAANAKTMELFAQEAVAIDGRVAELAGAWDELDRALGEL